MGKKMKKSPELDELENKNAQHIKINPEEIEHDFGVEFDEEKEEVLFVVSFRFKWGDPIDGDFEYVFNIGEAYDIARVIIEFCDKVKNKGLVKNEVPTPVEGNPMQDNKEV